MKLHGTEQYGGVQNSGGGYMDYEFFRGECDLWTITWSGEDRCWYGTYRSADTPDGDYGEPVGIDEFDMQLLRGRIPFGHMPIDYLNSFPELWEAEMEPEV